MKCKCKVDLTPFKDLIGYKDCYDLKEIVYRLCTDAYINLNLELDYESLDYTDEVEDGWGVFRLQDKVYKAEYVCTSYQGVDYSSIMDTLREVKCEVVTTTRYY